MSSSSAEPGASDPSLDPMIVLPSKKISIANNVRPSQTWNVPKCDKPKKASVAPTICKKLYLESVPAVWRPASKAGTPNTKNTLAMLEPTTLPKAIPG